MIDRAGLEFAVVESIAVHEDIKLGRPVARPAARPVLRERARHGRARHAGAVLQLHADLRLDAHRSGRGAARRLDRAVLRRRARSSRIDLSRGTGDLPGWSAAYDAEALQALLAAYKEVDAERLWENLAYFLERVAPEAERAGVRMAIHPDDPPWSIFGLPRIITSGAAFERLIDLVDSPANGVTLLHRLARRRPGRTTCPAIARRIGGRGRIHFAHCRNVAITGERAVPRGAAPVAVRQRADARRARRAARRRLHRSDASRSRPHDLGRAGPAGLRAARPRARRDVSPGSLGGTRAQRDRRNGRVGHLVRSTRRSTFAAPPHVRYPGPSGSIDATPSRRSLPIRGDAPAPRCRAPRADRRVARHGDEPTDMLEGAPASHRVARRRLALAHRGLARCTLASACAPAGRGAPARDGRGDDGMLSCGSMRRIRSARSSARRRPAPEEHAFLSDRRRHPRPGAAPGGVRAAPRVRGHRAHAADRSRASHHRAHHRLAARRAVRHRPRVPHLGVEPQARDGHAGRVARGGDRPHDLRDPASPARGACCAASSTRCSPPDACRPSRWSRRASGELRTYRISKIPMRLDDGRSRT